MKRLTFLTPILFASACMTMDLPTGGLDAEAPVAGSCNPNEAQQFVGRRATYSLGRSILSASNSRQLRWGGPDTAFTMDYRADRVNVLYDEGGTITRIYCG